MDLLLNRFILRNQTGRNMYYSKTFIQNLKQNSLIKQHIYLYKYRSNSQTLKK